MTKIWNYIFLTLILVLTTVWLAVFSTPKSSENMKIIACDVGQGDGILIVYKDIQILTDGGIPNGMVIDCLSKYIPFNDRTIEVVISTHPQLDHYGGLIEVFRRYEVDYFLANALESSSSEYQLLKKEVVGQGTQVVNPTDETSISYGLLHLDIFWPTLSFLESQGYKSGENTLGAFSSKKDPNDFSIQALISLGEFDALLTGDIGENISAQVIPYLPTKSVEYIKIPHHGSKYALTADYLKLIDPDFAVISSGKNSYGHPTSEILEVVKAEGIDALRTDTLGDVIVETDGKDYTKHYHSDKIEE